MNDFFKIDSRIADLGRAAEKNCRPQFDEIEEIADYNGRKVLSAFINNRVSEGCMKGTTGYGYGDIGRDALDAVYAEAFGGEDALVRHNFVNGTHTLSTALFGVLRSGDRMVSVTGRPYDTLEEVIGIRGENGNGSLTDFGVIYDEIPLLESGKVDLAAIPEKVKGAKAAYIQRSRGYSLRPTLTVEDIKEICDICRAANPDICIMVDNCYGEFVQTSEPLSAGADLIMGSLIKNPGGGIAETGGYIAGKSKYVELCSYRLTCVGMGKEVGCTLNQCKPMLQGFFFAPEVTAAAVKTAVFTCEIFNMLGYETFPKRADKRGDIITSVLLKNEENLTAFVQGIQKGAPVDAFVSPEAWDMPGYESKVIMAAGAFNMGSSIELSADAPIREPFAAWVQGGLTYPTGRTGILLAVQEMYDRGLLKL